MCKGRGEMIQPNLDSAAVELEELRRSEENSSDGMAQAQYTRFPLHCRKLLYDIPGNLYCVDCGATNPQWATLSFGALLCIDCSGRHRQMGVQVSVVRSITMDSWKHTDVLAMLEGGNKQLGDFFQRHGLSSDDPIINAQENVTMDRYRTNAAKFYKKNLSIHAAKVRDAGLYKGRDQFRKNSPKKMKNRQMGSVKGDSDGSRVGGNNQMSSPSQSCSDGCRALHREQRTESSSSSSSSVGAKA